MATQVATASVEMLLDRRKLDKSLNDVNRKVAQTAGATKKIDFRAAANTAGDVSSSLSKIQATIGLITAATVAAGLKEWLAGGSDSAKQMQDRLDLVKRSLDRLGADFASEDIFGRNSYEWAERLATAINSIDTSTLARLVEVSVALGAIKVGSEMFEGTLKMASVLQSGFVSGGAIGAGSAAVTGLSAGLGSGLGSAVGSIGSTIGSIGSRSGRFDLTRGLSAAQLATKIPRGATGSLVETITDLTASVINRKALSAIANRGSYINPSLPNTTKLFTNSLRSARSALVQAVTNFRSAMGRAVSALRLAVSSLGVFGKTLLTTGTAVGAYFAGRFIGERIPGLPATKRRQAGIELEARNEENLSRIRSAAVRRRQAAEGTQLTTRELGITGSDYQAKITLDRASRFGIELTKDELQRMEEVATNRITVLRDGAKRLRQVIENQTKRLNELDIEEAELEDQNRIPGLLAKRGVVEATKASAERDLATLKQGLSDTESVFKQVIDLRFRLWEQERERNQRLLDIGKEREIEKGAHEEDLKNLYESTKAKVSSIREVVDQRIEALQPRGVFSYVADLNQVFQRAFESGTARVGSEKSLQEQLTQDLLDAQRDYNSATKILMEEHIDALNDLKDLETEVKQELKSSREKNEEIFNWLKAQGEY